METGGVPRMIQFRLGKKYDETSDSRNHVFAVPDYNEDVFLEQKRQEFFFSDKLELKLGDDASYSLRWSSNVKPKVIRTVDFVCRKGFLDFPCGSTERVSITDMLSGEIYPLSISCPKSHSPPSRKEISNDTNHSLVKSNSEFMTPKKLGKKLAKLDIPSRLQEEDSSPPRSLFQTDSPSTPDRRFDDSGLGVSPLQPSNGEWDTSLPSRNGEGGTQLARRKQEESFDASSLNSSSSGEERDLYGPGSEDSPTRSSKK